MKNNNSRLNSKLTTEQRKLFEEKRRELDEKLKPLTDSIRRSQRITAEDLNIIVGPCR